MIHQVCLLLRFLVNFAQTLKILEEENRNLGNLRDAAPFQTLRFLPNVSHSIMIFFCLEALPTCQYVIRGLADEEGG